MILIKNIYLILMFYSILINLYNLMSYAIKLYKLNYISLKNIAYLFKIGFLHNFKMARK
jgi:hypothetical protein